jgi:surfactin synthase thioesterase subunit
MTADAEDPWVRRFGPAGNGPAQLVCFPHAGGSASYFRPMADLLGPHLRLSAVQYPGRQDRRRERLLPTIGELADQTYRALAAGFGDHPVAFFGHSMGAIVAFEVGRRMERERGSGPVMLFASGRLPPSRCAQTAIHRLGDQQLAEVMGSMGGTDAKLLLDPELRAMVLPAIRNDYRAIETYRYAPGSDLSCPIIAMIGDDDPGVTPADAADWAQHTTGPFQLRVFRGGHFYLADHAREVAELVSDSLLAFTHQ